MILLKHFLTMFAIVFLISGCSNKGENTIDTIYKEIVEDINGNNNQRGVSAKELERFGIKRTKEGIDYASAFQKAREKHLFVDAGNPSKEEIQKVIDLMNSDSDGDGIADLMDEESISKPEETTGISKEKENENNTTKIQTKQEPNPYLNIEYNAQENTRLYDSYAFYIDINSSSEYNVTIDSNLSWLYFDKNISSVRGYVLDTDLGVYDVNISIFNNDGIKKMINYKLEVEKEIDIAHAYGKATQSSTKSGAAASRAIDHNDTSANETFIEDDSGVSWWQVEIPKDTIVRKARFMPRNVWYRDLEGAKVYFSDTPYTKEIIKKDPDVILKKGLKEQIFHFDQGKRATYIIVIREKGTKKHDSHLLNIASVELYGSIQERPVIKSSKQRYLIASYNGKKGYMIESLESIDYQEDNIYFEVDNSNFYIDSKGRLYFASMLAPGKYTVTVKATDKSAFSTISLEIVITDNNALDKILSSGNIFDAEVSKDEILDAITALRKKAKKINICQDIYKNLPIIYTPKKNASSYFEYIADMHHTTPILLDGARRVLGIIYNKYDGELITLLANPLRDSAANSNSEFDENLKNIFDYLLKGRNDIYIEATKNDKEMIKGWLDRRFDSLVYKDSQTLKDTDASLVILNRYSYSGFSSKEFKDRISQILENNQSVIYLHDSWYGYPKDLASFSRAIMHYNGRIYAKDGEGASWSSCGDMEKFLYGSNIDNLFENLKSRYFDVDEINTYPSSMDFENQKIIYSQFLSAALAIKSQIDYYDKNKINLFGDHNASANRFDKLLVLLADKYRQEISYPIDKSEPSRYKFFHSLFADHVVHNFRSINPKQPDMGNFSRSDFDHITTVEKTVNIKSKKYYKSAGVYALPGKSVTVTRLDSSNTSVRVGISLIRPGATREYGAYNRPKYLKSVPFDIAPNETIKITSPYGGIIFLYFRENDHNISVKFENVGVHPQWRSSADNDKFALELEADEYDWAEIITESFELHSKISKIKKTISDSANPERVKRSEWTYITDNLDAPSASDIANAIQKYTSNYPYAIAGFRGKGIDSIAEVEKFANEYNLSIPAVSFVQHMNADQANCGSGCSGNPYDAYWNFDPVGHGDIHEIGHNLEKGLFRFNGWEVHATTNIYPFYTKSRYYYLSKKDPNCKKLPFKKPFDAIMNDTMESYWKSSGWDTQFMFLLQSMYVSQEVGDLDNGWHLMARLHLLEREFYKAKRSEEAWLDKRAYLGMYNYSLNEAKSLKSNDWMAISLSWASKLDFRDYLDMWKLDYTQKAASQIESFGYISAPREYFVPQEPNGYCYTSSSGAIAYDKKLDMTKNMEYPY